MEILVGACHKPILWARVTSQSTALCARVTSQSCGRVPYSWPIHNTARRGWELVPRVRPTNSSWPARSSGAKQETDTRVQMHQGYLQKSMKKKERTIINKRTLNALVKSSLLQGTPKGTRFGRAASSAANVSRGALTRSPCTTVVELLNC